MIIAFIFVGVYAIFVTMAADDWRRKRNELSENSRNQRLHANYLRIEIKRLYQQQISLLDQLEHSEKEFLWVCKTNQAEAREGHNEYLEVPPRPGRPDGREALAPDWAEGGIPHRNHFFPSSED